MPTTTTSRPALKRVQVTLTTRYGRAGVGWLDKVAPMAWDSDGDDETTLAKLDLVVGGETTESFSITGDGWRAFESEGDIDEFLRDVQSCGIEAALRVQLDLFENHYDHDECGATWTDQHSCGCDDKCPSCGAAISPHDSIQLAGLDEEVPAGYADALAESPMPPEALTVPVRPGRRGS